MTTKNTNWAARGKAQIAAQPTTKPAQDYGTPIHATIDSAIRKIYKTGSVGVELRYRPQDDNMRLIYENVVLQKATPNAAGAFDYAPTTNGLRNLQFRIDAGGGDFKPEEATDELLATLVGAPVTLKVVTEEYLGKERFAVRAVFPRD